MDKRKEERAALERFREERRARAEAKDRLATIKGERTRLEQEAAAVQRRADELRKREAEVARLLPAAEAPKSQPRAQASTSHQSRPKPRGRASERSASAAPANHKWQRSDRPLRQPRMPSQVPAEERLE